MKDPNIQALVDELQNHVDDVNRIMSDLGKLNVEVRISYVDQALSKDISQGINLWKIIEHNDYLKKENGNTTNPIN
jgi:hypothetical protein